MSKRSGTPSSEEDYMKMDLLPLEEKVIKTKSKKKTKKVIEPVKKDEKEILMDTLNQPIRENNVGFKLLSKMGFNKQITKENAPIPIQLKQETMGLGLSTLIKEKEQKVIEKQKQINEHNQQNFVSFTRNKAKTRLLFKDWCKVRQVAEQLDRQNNIEDNLLWSAFLEQEELDFENVDVLLEDTLKYLKNTYFYCFYCGIKYEDDKDIKENCPGLLREDHDDL